MSYLGNTPITQSFIAGTDTFSGTGAQVAFTLSRSVNSVNDILVVVNNVDQQPTAYSASGTTLTFTAAPSSGTNNIYVRYLTTTLQSITVPGGSTVVGNFGLTGDLQFAGTAQRITGDFSNATVANRVMFQTSTANSQTGVLLIPNGTAAQAIFEANSDSSGGVNGSIAQVGVYAAGDVRLSSDKRGTGTHLPMTFYTGGSERMRIDSAGNLLFNSGYGSVATAYGCRAWVNFNGTGTVAIRGSGNVTSITDNGVGNYTVNFTNAMPDANYAVNCHISNSASASQLQGNGAGVLSGSYRITVANPGVSAVDPLYLFAAIFR